MKVHGAQRQNDIGGMLELDCVRARQQQRAGGVDLLDPDLRGGRIDGLGVVALQAEDDRAAGVPCPAPVAPSEPYNSIRTRATFGSSPSSVR
jgi:hypothetical protein